MRRGLSTVLIVLSLGCAVPAVEIQPEIEAPCLVPEDQRDTAMGLYQASSAAPGTWHHVGTVHGWAEDYDVCREIANFLSDGEPGEVICRALGEGAD